MNAAILPAGKDPMAEEKKPPDDGESPEQNKPADETPQESANGAAPAGEPQVPPPAPDDNKKWYVAPDMQVPITTPLKKEDAKPETPAKPAGGSAKSSK